MKTVFSVGRGWVQKTGIGPISQDKADQIKKDFCQPGNVSPVPNTEWAMVRPVLGPHDGDRPTAEGLSTFAEHLKENMVSIGDGHNHPWKFTGTEDCSNDLVNPPIINAILESCAKQEIPEGATHYAVCSGTGIKSYYKYASTAWFWKTSFGWEKSVMNAAWLNDSLIPLNGEKVGS